MRGDGTAILLQQLAPTLVAGALLLLLLRHLGVPLPIRPLQHAGLAALALAVLAIGIQALDGTSAGQAIAAWLLLGLPAYLVRRWSDGAAAREAAEERLRQDRGHERRRAPPQGGAAGTTGPGMPTVPNNSNNRSAP
jgi:hypothetical protein